jgi:enamine deaminase RidA (YjgF/YER057c/UK114 family)
MKKAYKNPAGVFRHPGFTRVVTVEGPTRFIFIAGQTASDENYKCVAPGDLKAQYLKVMQNLEIQLKEAGAGWGDVIYRRTFVLDMDEYLRVRKDRSIPNYWNADNMPGSTSVAVSRLSDPQFLIEIDLLAAVAA